MELAVSLILISVLSFARAQVDCPPFNVSELGATDMLTRGGLIGDAFAAASGDPTMPVSVQVHDSNVVCLRSGRTRDTYSGVSVVVNYTCTGAPSECTGNPILSQFEFECATGPTWTASVGGSASNIITTPPNGTLSTPLRTDCGVCISPARSGFATITDNEQHCGSCNPACNTGLMMCFSRLNSACCNFFENDMCVASCTSPLVPNSNFDCASPTTMLISSPTSSIPTSSTSTSSTPTSSIPTSSTSTSSTPTSSTPTSSTSTSSTPTSSIPTSSMSTSSTPTSSTPTSSSPTSMPPNRFDGGKIAGIVIGLVLFLILLIIIVAVVGYCVIRKKRRYTKV